MFGGAGIAPQGSGFHGRLYRQPHPRRRLILLAALSARCARSAGSPIGVSDSLVWLDHTALFLGAPRRAPTAPARPLDLIQKEIRRLAEDGPTEDELAKAKAYLKGSFALNFDTSTKIARSWCRCSSTISASTTSTRRPAMIDAVTLDDAKRVAKRLLDGGLLVTVVGKPEGVTSTQPGELRPFARRPLRRIGGAGERPALQPWRSLDELATLRDTC